MAGVSSFIFQLPLQLIFFECHVIEQRWTSIAGLEWIGDTLGWLGECVSPLSLLAMGSWMHSQHYLSSSQRIHISKLCIFMEGASSK
eukprot:scaffold30177_cov67-Skeletonema_dohrnii-CCMP3373.AAC.1